MTVGATDRLIRLRHLADGFKLILTVVTFVFVYRHILSILRVGIQSRMFSFVVGVDFHSARYCYFFLSAISYKLRATNISPLSPGSGTPQTRAFGHTPDTIPNPRGQRNRPRPLARYPRYFAF